VCFSDTHFPVALLSFFIVIVVLVAFPAYVFMQLRRYKQRKQAKLDGREMQMFVDADGTSEEHIYICV
jgi:hypothetical protein